MSDVALDTIYDYHQVSKHSFQASAPGPGYLDWATQPDPFRRYAGAPEIPLAHLSTGIGPGYAARFTPGMIPSLALDYQSVSRIFLDSLALSAWKEYGGSRWALRVNPSSGNLHPTECYLICGPVPNLCADPLIAHYAPREHALEVRAALPADIWRRIAAPLPDHAVLIGLTSIHWREAWKYGERAYRYCQHDVGHALAAISIAAAGMGWQAQLVDMPGTAELSALMGVFDAAGAEPEHPDCLIVVFPRGAPATPTMAPLPVAALRELVWQGRPNRLSATNVDWPWIEEAMQAAVKPRTGDQDIIRPPHESHFPSSETRTEAGLREIIHQRRSAVEMDGETNLSREALYAILQRTMPAAAPFDLLPWEPCVHLGLFVHRVRDLAPGLYLLIRDRRSLSRLQAAIRADALWETPPGCPPELPFFKLREGDTRPVARQLSCGQDIAADGCFSVAMLTDFERPLRSHGAWFYPRLYWECGMVGQVLYLEAEAAGIRGTGIGCFFDNPVLALFGLEGEAFQSLYHFTVGGPEEDQRLTTLPPYPASGER